ncbi:MAG: hypothetical protein WBP75_02930, partial [Candidatus Cybelea sp.]
GLAGGEGVDIGPEDLLGVDFDFEDLVARLGVVGGGDDEVDAAIEGSGAEFGAEGDGEARLRGGTFLSRGLRRGGEDGDKDEERSEA